MKRVLERVRPEYAPPPPGGGPGIAPPPPPPGEKDACVLLEREQRLEREIRNVSARSREGRRALRDVYSRSERRARALRADCFLRRGGRENAAPPARTHGGALSSLREIHAGLEALAAGYEKAAAGDPRRRDMFRRFASECVRDARWVRQLLDRAMR